MTDATESTVRALLADRAFLFRDPDAYLAGVDDALRARRRPSGPVGSTTNDPSSDSDPLDGRGEE